MFCSHCGKIISDNAAFCTYCGKPRSRSDLSLMSMKCPECGASMEYSSSQPILQCPFCGNKNLIIENKDVQIARINADASIMNNKMRYDLNRDVTKMQIDRDIEVERIRNKQPRDLSGLWRLIEILLSLLLIVGSMVSCFKAPDLKGHTGAYVFIISIVVFIFAMVLFIHSVRRK